MQIKSAKLASTKRATSVHEWTFWSKGAWWLVNVYTVCALWLITQSKWEKTKIEQSSRPESDDRVLVDMFWTWTLTTVLVPLLKYEKKTVLYYLYFKQRRRWDVREWERTNRLSLMGILARNTRKLALVNWVMLWSVAVPLCPLTYH